MPVERHGEQRSRGGCGTCKQRRKRCDQDWELVNRSASSSGSSSLTCQACKARQEVCQPPKDMAEALAQAKARGNNTASSSSSSPQRPARSHEDRQDARPRGAASSSTSSASAALPFFYNLPAGHAPLPVVPGVTSAAQSLAPTASSPSATLLPINSEASALQLGASTWLPGAATRLQSQLGTTSTTPANDAPASASAWPLDFVTPNLAWGSDGPTETLQTPAQSFQFNSNVVGSANVENIGQDLNQQQAEGWNDFMRTLAAIAADTSSTPKSAESHVHRTTPGSAGAMQEEQTHDAATSAGANRMNIHSSLLSNSATTSSGPFSTTPAQSSVHGQGAQQARHSERTPDFFKGFRQTDRDHGGVFADQASLAHWPSTCSPPANGGTGESCAPLRPVLASSRLDALLEHYMPIFSKLILIYTADAPWLPRFLEIACTNEMSKASVVAVVAAFHERLFGDPTLEGNASSTKRGQGSSRERDVYPDGSGEEDEAAVTDDEFEDHSKEWRSSSRRRKRRRRPSGPGEGSDTEHELDASARSRSPPRPFPVVRLARAAFQQSGLSPHAGSPDGTLPGRNGHAEGNDRRSMPAEAVGMSSAHLHAAARRSQARRSEATQMVLSPAPWWQLAYSLLFSPFSNSSPLEVKIMTILNLKCAVLCVEGGLTARRLMDRLPEILSHPSPPDRSEPTLLTLDEVSPHMSQDHAMLDVWSRLLVSELMQRASETSLSSCTFPTPNITFLRTVYWLQDAACPHELPLLMSQASKLGARRKSKSITQQQAVQEAEMLEAAILEATVTPCQKWTLTQRAAKFWAQEAWRRAAIIHLNTAGLGRGPLYCKVRSALYDILRCNANVPAISVRSIERWYSHAIWIMAGIASVTQQDRTVCLTNLRAVSIEKAHRESALRLQKFWSVSDTLGNAPDWFDDRWGGGEPTSLVLY